MPLTIPSLSSRKPFSLSHYSCRRYETPLTRGVEKNLRSRFINEFLIHKGQEQTLVVPYLSPLDANHKSLTFCLRILSDEVSMIDWSARDLLKEAALIQGLS
jgi:hypothetical protein